MDDAAVDADRTDLTKRQAEIRHVATELFAKHGYRAVGMRAIADAVGIRTSSLYYHFASKEQILYSIGLDLTRDFVEGHLSLLSRSGSYAERLAALVRAHVTFFVDHRLEEQVAKRELRELADDHLRSVMHFERLYRAHIREFLEHGTAAGEFDVADARIASLALLDMLNGVNGWYRAGGPLAVEELANRYVALACNLVGAEAVARRAVRPVA